MAQYAFSLLLGINLLFADVYIVSYQAQVKDASVLHQSLLASKAMTDTDDKTVIKSTTIDLDKSCTIKQFFSCYEDQILEFLFTEGVHIDARDKTSSLVTQSTFIELNLPPQHVQVEFNDTFVKMALLR